MCCRRLITRELTAFRTSLQFHALESDRYLPFIEAFDRAFECLQKISLPPLRDYVVDTGVMLHCNDKRSQRKPDIVIVELDDARAAYEIGETASWPEMADGHAVGRPTIPFTWAGPLSSLELRYTKKTLGDLPKVYKNKAVEPVAPQTFSELKYWLEHPEPSEDAAAAEKTPQGAGGGQDGGPTESVNGKFADRFSLITGYFSSSRFLLSV